MHLTQVLSAYVVGAWQQRLVKMVARAINIV